MPRALFELALVICFEFDLFLRLCEPEPFRFDELFEGRQVLKERCDVVLLWTCSVSAVSIFQKYNNDSLDLIFQTTRHSEDQLDPFLDNL